MADYELCIRHLTAMKEVMRSRQQADADIVLQLKTIAEDLLEFSDQAVIAGCKSWRRSEMFFPVSMEIRNRCREHELVMERTDTKPAVQARVWVEAQDHLRRLIGDAKYNAWITLCFGAQDDGKRLVIHMPTKFCRDWVVANFKDDMEAAVQRVIEIVVRPTIPGRHTAKMECGR